MSRIVWTGPVNGERMRVIDADGVAIAERLLGHDAMGGERWERLHARQAIEDLRATLPKEIGLVAKPKTPSQLPYGLVALPKGCTFRDLTRMTDDGVRALLLTFPVGFDQDADGVAAVEAALSGTRGKLALDGYYERGSFVVESIVQHPSVSADSDPVDPMDEPVLEDRGCKMVTAALRDHLRHGDPEERFALSNSKVVTARKLLELLEADDSVALRFVQDVHKAALRSVRQRPRQASRSPRW